MIENIEENTPLVTHIYTADPSAHIFENKIYIYPSHDLDVVLKSNDSGDQYNMEDYHVLVFEKGIVKDCGETLHLRNIPWASRQLWAPDCVYKNNTYYLVFPARDREGIFRLGVASSRNPTGPFTPEIQYIPNSFSIDPAVFIDTDGKTYVYFGGLWGGQLEKWQTGIYLENGKEPQKTAPALGPRITEFEDNMLTFKSFPCEIQINDKRGKPLLSGDEDYRYFEAPWMHKYNEIYYLSYSTGTTHRIVYATSNSPQGPFTCQGKILDPVVGWTTHHSIVCYNDRWYLFYHDSSLSRGADNRRCVKYVEIFYNQDGTIVPVNSSPLKKERARK